MLRRGAQDGVWCDERCSEKCIGTQCTNPKVFCQTNLETGADMIIPVGSCLSVGCRTAVTNQCTFPPPTDATFHLSQCNAWTLLREYITLQCNANFTTHISSHFHHNALHFMCRLECTSRADNVDAIGGNWKLWLRGQP